MTVVLGRPTTAAPAQAMGAPATTEEVDMDIARVAGPFVEAVAARDCFFESRVRGGLIIR